MFDHLDDPNPAPIGDHTRRQVAARVSALTRRRQLTYGGAIVAAVVLAAGGVGFAVSSSSKNAQKIVTNPIGTATTTAPTTAPTPTASTSTTRPPVTAITATTTAPTTVPAVPEALVCGSLRSVGGEFGRSEVKVSDGSYTATISATAQSAIDNSLVSPRLQIVAAGRTVLDEPLAAPRFPGATDSKVILASLNVPLHASGGSSIPASTPLCLGRFAGLSSATVLIGFFEGGAHCCFALRAVPVAGAGQADLITGNASVWVTTEQGDAVAITADDSFAYTFASYAASGMPIRIYTYSPSGFADQTRRHTGLVDSDATLWWQAFNAPSGAGNGLGSLAAWAGDDCLLGKSPFPTIDQLNTEGKLAGPSGWPSGDAYVSSLRTFLTQHHYC